MHLHTPIGTLVTFHGSDGQGVEGIAAQTFLVVGQQYTVASIDIPHRWVCLAEWPDQHWNISMFDDNLSDDIDSVDNVE